MKRSTIWDTLAHTPILDVIAVEHEHEKDARGRSCKKARSLTVGADVHDRLP